MKLLTLALSLALVSPASAGTMACLVGDPNEMLAKLMVTSGERPLLRFEIETGAEPTPAILLGKPDGTFSIAVPMKGMACIMAVGKGMAPAAVDQRFPTIALPGKSS